MLFNFLSFQHRHWKFPCGGGIEAFWRGGRNCPLLPGVDQITPPSPSKLRLCDIQDDRDLDFGEDSSDSGHVVFESGTESPDSDYPMLNNVSSSNTPTDSSSSSSPANEDEDAAYVEAVLKRDLPEAVWE